MSRTVNGMGQSPPLRAGNVMFARSSTGQPTLSRTSSIARNVSFSKLSALITLHGFLALRLAEIVNIPSIVGELLVAQAHGVGQR